MISLKITSNLLYDAKWVLLHERHHPAPLQGSAWWSRRTVAALGPAGTESPPWRGPRTRCWRAGASFRGSISVFFERPRGSPTDPTRHAKKGAPGLLFQIDFSQSKGNGRSVTSHGVWSAPWSCQATTSFQLLQNNLQLSFLRLETEGYLCLLPPNETKPEPDLKKKLQKSLKVSIFREYKKEATLQKFKGAL